MVKEQDSFSFSSRSPRDQTKSSRGPQGPLPESATASNPRESPARQTVQEAPGRAEIPQPAHTPPTASEESGGGWGLTQGGVEGLTKTTGA